MLNGRRGFPEEAHRRGRRDAEFQLHFVDESPVAENELAKRSLPLPKWPEARTSQHNEFYWRSRAWRALTFLFSLAHQRCTDSSAQATGLGTRPTNSHLP